MIEVQNDLTGCSLLITENLRYKYNIKIWERILTLSENLKSYDMHLIFNHASDYVLNATAKQNG